MASASGPTFLKEAALKDQARTQDFEKGGSEYCVAVRPRREGGCGREAFTLWMI